MDGGVELAEEASLPKGIGDTNDPAFVGVLVRGPKRPHCRKALVTRDTFGPDATTLVAEEASLPKGIGDGSTSAGESSRIMVGKLTGSGARTGSTVPETSWPERLSPSKTPSQEAQQPLPKTPRSLHPHHRKTSGRAGGGRAGPCWGSLSRGRSFCRHSPRHSGRLAFSERRFPQGPNLS
jgi:hypothetical protein